MRTSDAPKVVVLTEMCVCISVHMQMVLAWWRQRTHFGREKINWRQRNESNCQSESRRRRLSFVVTND